ncbi:MAG: zinc ribbon domain-containing protein [Candidatus Ruminococcus intestinipullorum]|nr:zinc ribbon domain-containing protein [Candidatus Ruminococcus intestinipullorum]
MRTFFEDLGKFLGDTTDTVATKAGEIMEVQRLKGQIRSFERENLEDILEMGRRIFEQYQSGEEVLEDQKVLCEGIEERNEKIEACHRQIEKVRGAKACSKCGEPISENMAFCPYCGEKVEKCHETEEACCDEEAEDVVAEVEEVEDTVSEAEVEVEEVEEADTTEN